ncbi:MAG: GTP cyclohydrolase II [Pikeienuella sp.]
MFGLTAEEILSRARTDLRIGAPVALSAGDTAVIAVSAELITDARVATLRELGEELDVVVTGRRATTLKARAYDGDIARISLRDDMGAGHAQAIADPAAALGWPMMGPFDTQRGGDAAAHRLAVKLAKSARLLPAVVTLATSPATAAEIATKASLTLIDQDMWAKAEEAAIEMTLVSSARVPLAVSEDSRVHVFRPANGEEEHYAIEVGAPNRAKPVLSRLHSACFTGDLIGSLKCDCGPQLRAALNQIGTEGAGVLLYLNQEGRGIGLANKMRAYSLQDQGFDTVEANHRLGFEDDERDFRIGSALLRSLGFSSVRLMTNNPGKVAAMNATGVEVTERVPLIVGENAHNIAYLKTKAAKSGHLL